MDDKLVDSLDFILWGQLCLAYGIVTLKVLPFDFFTHSFVLYTCGLLNAQVFIVENDVLFQMLLTQI